MNHQSHEEWPEELQKAVREYPRIVASPDFNQRVLQALTEKQSRHNKIDAFCNALDRIFERPILKLLATSLFAILLAWGGANLISTFAFPNLSKQANTISSYQINLHAQSLDAMTRRSGSLYAWDLEVAPQMRLLDTTPSQQKAPIDNSNSTNKKETSCSPNETILWG